MLTLLQTSQRLQLRAEEEAKSTLWELDELDLELSMAMDPESFVSKVLNPKKRKPDPETDGEGLPQHPAAKRKSDGASETSKRFSISKPISIPGTTNCGTGDAIRGT